MAAYLEGWTIAIVLCGSCQIRDPLWCLRMEAGEAGLIGPHDGLVLDEAIDVLVVQAGIETPDPRQHPLASARLPARIPLHGRAGDLPHPDQLATITRNVGDPVADLVARQVVERIFVVVSSAGERCGVLNAGGQPAPTPAWIDQAMSLLQAQPVEALPSPSALAGRLGISRSHFSSAFQIHVGMSYTSYVRRLKITAAQRLIGRNHHGWSLQAIAERCGFTSHAQLTREFKRVTGSTPTEWRQQQTHPALERVFS